MNPKISIIIPTFNRADYLAQTVESALAQDYPFFEVVVTDNASSDETPDIVKRFAGDGRFRYFRNEQNLGMVPNWRKAVYEHSSGDFFLILSDDDFLIDRAYLTKAARLIREHPDIVLVYANGHILYEPAQKKIPLMLPFREIEDGKTVFLSKGRVKPQDFMLCNVLFKRRLAMELNAFANDYNICGDSELFLKMCLFGRVGVVDDFVSVYRIHGDNLLHSTGLDLDILVNNLDFLLEPCRLAAEKNILSRRELRHFEKRLVLPAIRGLLMTTITWHEAEYETVIAKLKEKNPQSLNRARSHPFFQMKFFIAKNARFLYYCISGSYRRKLALNKTTKKSM